MSVQRCAPRDCRRRRRDGRAAPRRRQRGVALIVAILLVALGTIIAAAMAYDNAMTARRAAATFDFDQALLTAEGAEALAAYGLQQQVRQNAAYISPVGQAWSQPLGPTEVIPDVMLQASLQDLQGRFNLNELVQNDGETPNTAAIAAFQRLLALLGMDRKWADYIVDWIDKDSTPMFPDGAEDSVYMEMDPPYRTPNLPITSTSELMALPGFTRADFDRLAPYIAALPLGTKINICSASPYVLDALSGVVEYSSDPAGFEKLREDAGGCFPQMNLFLQIAANSRGGGGPRTSNSNPQQSPLATLIEQKSRWFRLTSFVTEGSTEFAVYTTLYLDPGTGTVRPVMRSFTPN